MFFPIAIIVGIILLIISIITLRSTLAFIKNNERAIGRVSKLIEVKDDDGATHLPEFKFTTNNNQDFTYRHPTASYPAKWAIGDKMTFIYDPNDPTTARPLTYSGIFGWTIILMAIAIDFIIIGSSYYLLQGYFQ
jgi:hypothetical protein